MHGKQIVFKAVTFKFHISVFMIIFIELSLLILPFLHISQESDLFVIVISMNSLSSSYLYVLAYKLLLLIATYKILRQQF